MISYSEMLNAFMILSVLCLNIKKIMEEVMLCVSQVEGYTLEMPGGIFLCRLFRRNLQMLKRVSGMWELKGSSWTVRKEA